jgi:Flp pilus assembly protein TadD
MLYTSYKKNKIARVVVALLFAITCIAFHNQINAQEMYAAALTAEDYRARGYIEQKKGNLREALTFYEKALSLGLESAMIYNDIGIVCEKIGVFLKAEFYYRKAIELDGQYLPAYTNLSYLYIEKGFPKKAIPYLKKRYRLGGHGDFWTERVKEELLRIDPSTARWINRLEKKRLQEASRALEQDILREVRNEFEEIVQTSESHCQQGYAFLQDGKYALAESEFERALSITPDNPKIMDALSLVYAKQGDWLCEKGLYEEAIAAYEKSLQIRPDNQTVKQSKRFAQKESVKQKASTQIKAAQDLLDSGDFMSAEKKIRDVLTIIPNDAK